MESRQLPSDCRAQARSRRVGERSHGPNAGVADSLDEAKAAFRAAWGAGALTDGVPGRGRSASAFFRKSRPDMLNLSISTDDPKRLSNRKLPSITRRWYETTELTPEKFSKRDRRAVLKVWSQNLYSNRETRLRTLNGHHSGRKPRRSGRLRPH